MEEKELMTEVLRRALDHYSEKLAKLQDSPDIELGNDILSTDMERISKDAKRISEIVNVGIFRVTIEDHKETVSCALASYVGDLIESKKTLYAKLHAKPELQNMEEEIMWADKMSFVYCGKKLS